MHHVSSSTGKTSTGSTVPADGAPDLMAVVLQNTPSLLEGPNSELRRAVLEVAVKGMSAADPGPATVRAVSFNVDTDTLSVDGQQYPMNGRGQILVVGAGKASYPIAVALHDLLGSRLSGGVVAVRDPEAPQLPNIEVLWADHPLPTDRSIRAAQQILACVAEATADDIVITCFTGGSSALSSLPPANVTPADKRRLHQQLLSSGLPITDVNAVRKQVSAVKGGRVALAARPARVINLTVSDVAGSPLDAVTDPTVQDTSTAARARSVLQQAELWNLVPASVREHLEQNLSTPELAAEPQTVILADGARTVAAMATAARERGYHPVVVEREIEGDADDVGEYLAQRVLDEVEAHESSVMVLGCGGEAVVAVTSDSEFGQGGPNQHAAIKAAEVLSGWGAAGLFVDTDGSDGGTAYAGALIDGSTVERAAQLGIDLIEARRAQRSTKACEQLGLAVRTGHTGTNVNDLFVLLATREAAS
jgi:glycerate-2-kinase